MVETQQFGWLSAALAFRRTRRAMAFARCGMVAPKGGLLIAEALPVLHPAGVIALSAALCLAMPLLTLETVAGLGVALRGPAARARLKLIGCVAEPEGFSAGGVHRFHSREVGDAGKVVNFF